MRRGFSRFLNLALFLIAVITTMSSCLHYYYVQNAHNVPFFREKNEYRLSAFGGFGDESASVELQGAWSAGKRFALSGNFMTAFKGSDSGGEYSKGSGTYFDISPGFYIPAGEHFVFETYAGAGLASETHHYSSYDSYIGDIVDGGSASLAFNKLFLQPSIGFSIDWFDIAFSSRASRICFTKVEDNSIDGEPFGLDMLQETPVYFLLEPAITIRVGLEKVKVHFQYAYNYNLTNPDVMFEQPKFTIGMVFLFSKKADAGKQ